MRVIVCGGRNYTDRDAVFRALDKMHRGFLIEAVIHGNASGADRLGGEWATARGVANWPVPAQWSKFGKSAGPRRNQAMLGMGVDLVAAFPGGTGTKDMVRRAEKAGVRVVKFEEARE